jgi:hypothetical protein
MKAIVPFSMVAALFLAGCGGSSNSNNSSATNNVATNTTAKSDSGNPATVAPNYLGAVAQAEKYSENKIDLAYVSQAIQQFNAAEGRYPKTLQELVPNYLAKVPEAPSGYKILYDANAGTVKIVKTQ